MAPKSSDGEVTDGTGSSSDLDMETSLGVALSLMGKRRAETDDSGESGQTADDEDSDELDEEGVEENELDEDNDELDEDSDELDEEEGESEQTADDEDGVEENELDEDSDEEDEEEGEDEEDEEEGEDGESYKNEENREPEWGYDSFDGREYESPNLGEEYSDKEFEEQCRHYKRQLIQTKGFFENSDKFPPYIYTPGIASLGDLDEPAMLGLTIREVCEKLASICLQRYNEDEEKNVKLDHILRANYNPGSMTKFYITFAAREPESPDAPLVEYQAKAVWSVLHVIYPILCRPSPAPKRLIVGDGREHVKEVAKVMEEIKSFIL